MNILEQRSTRIYRLGWRGMLYHSDAWLYLAPDTPGCLVLALMVGLYVPSLFLSYLKVSPDGLELHYWPTYRVRVAWQEVERVGKCKLLGLFPCEALYLNRAEARGRKATIREWGLAKRCIIPLSDFRGWPAGGLAEDLRRYVPHVFEIEEKE
jgi:hypothetical protein